MKMISVLFAVLMFAILFVAPVAQAVFSDEVSFCLQEIEDSDIEEGPDTKVEDVQEKLIRSQAYNVDIAEVFICNSYHLNEQKKIFASQELSVEIPPPEWI